MTPFLTFYLAFNCSSLFLLATLALSNLWLDIFNPIVLYNKTRLNVFGTILAILILHLLWLPYALCYWLYKLCTMGRR